MTAFAGIFVQPLGHHRVFHLDIDLLLSPIGGRHKAVEPRQMQEETHQANTACPDCDTDQMASHHESVEERQSGTAVKEVGDVRTTIEGVVPEAPGLQGGARHLELFGSLTLGDALHAQLPVLCKEVCAFESIPTGVAFRVKLLLLLDDGSHSDLLCQSLACLWGWLRMVRSPLRFNLDGGESLIFLGSQGGQVAHSMIQAR